MRFKQCMMKAVCLTAILVGVSCIQVYAGSWLYSGAQYTYYEGKPGATGATWNVRVKEGSHANTPYMLYADNKLMKNCWLGVKPPETDKLYWCYFGENGREAEGWKEVEGSWYYFSGFGALEGWNRIDQEYYYFDSVTKQMRTSGTEKRDGLTYEFSSNGRSHQIDGLVNAGQDGTDGWKQENDRWYYLKGGVKVTNEWLNNGNEAYYVGADGACYTGWQQVNGELYYFDQAGKLVKNDTAYYNGKKYMLAGDGRASELAMTQEEKMIYSNALKWCQSTYAIYTVSQTDAEQVARIQGVKIPTSAEILQRDWGISTKEQCVTVIQDLKNSGQTSDRKSEKAWNFNRAMILCENMQTMGWVTLSERIDMQLEIAPLIQVSFTSWQDYNDSYMEGFRGWATNEEIRKYREGAYNRIKESTYYFQVEWNQSLTKTW